MNGLADLQVQGGTLPPPQRYGSVSLNPTGGNGQGWATNVAGTEALSATLSLVGLEGGQLLVGFELEADALMSAGGLLCWGSLGPGRPRGGWAIEVGADRDRPLILSIQGSGSSSPLQYLLMNKLSRGPNSRSAYVLDFIGIGPDRASVRLMTSRLAGASTDPARRTAEPVDLRGGGGEPPSVDPGCGLSLFAVRRNESTASDPLRGAWVSNVWAQRRTGIDESLAVRCCIEMLQSPREFPACMRV